MKDANTNPAKSIFELNLLLHFLSRDNYMEDRLDKSHDCFNEV